MGALVMDPHSVHISDDVLQLHDHWDDDVCNLVISILDAIDQVHDFIVDQFVKLLPSLIVDFLDEELQEVLPQSQTISLKEIGIAESVDVCYQNATILHDAVAMGVAFQFDNDSFSDFKHRKRTDSDAADFDIEGSNLMELPLLAVVFALSVIFGAAFNYRRWKRRESEGGDDSYCCRGKKRRESQGEYKRSILESSLSNDLNFSYEVRAAPMNLVENEKPTSTLLQFE